ncbi:hypothetical protein SBBP1_730043 [Burkholderiales bacterium]|nr:hypothetical protein SBBP1_730043 [Burkholderiales bacterium]
MISTRRANQKRADRAACRYTLTVGAFAPPRSIDPALASGLLAETLVLGRPRDFALVERRPSYRNRWHASKRYDSNASCWRP